MPLKIIIIINLYKLKSFNFRDLVKNNENTNLYNFAFNSRLLNFILITWINGLKSCVDYEIFRNEIILEDVSFIINCIVKHVNSR